MAATKGSPWMGPSFTWMVQDPRGPWTRCSTRPCLSLQTRKTVRQANGLRDVDWTFGKLILFMIRTKPPAIAEGSETISGVDGEQDARRNRRADNAGDVRAHGVHQQEVGRVLLWPTFWDTRAAIGTAETPAEPISGLTLPLVKIYISLPNRTPPAVPTQRQTGPGR